ncbi:VOC family protein [Inquilinus limosus]|uniref:Glyoxalase/bleomycin resistance/dioxygenase family protein n=1 Tax=Inquilinus limosus TaxID=171674 RepID=A0A211ZSE9_9PROT|nr:VOC family protein [Inquilinus limosus]OWJ68201.1 glyoxalase/bleomycin resistance/dioxygenase family protein [Inquilinus limosus]
MGRLREIVFESRSAPALARFWAAALDGYAVRPYDQAEIERLAALGLTPETDPVVLVDGPGPCLCFHQVPGRDYGNNRVHLDIAAPDRAAEVRRLLALGATIQREADGYTVLVDPEGNQFCIIETRAG